MDTPKSYLALIGLCLLLYIPGLVTIPPVDRDEARFAQATKQMLESRNFVLIKFQDQARNKKPIGIYWLQAATVLALGDSKAHEIWPYRVPSVLGAMTAILFLFASGKKLFDRRVAWLAAALCATSLLLVVEAHCATTDAVLLACVVAAQGALGRYYLRAHHGPETGYGTFLIFWVAQGIGLLIKGPILPMVSLLTIGGLLAVDRDAEWLKGLRPVLGLTLVLAIVAPWGIAIGMATKGAYYHDAIGRDLLAKVFSGQESHGFPPGYYLLLLPLTFWPGYLFVPPTLLRSWRLRSSAVTRFCLAWIIPTWIVFELIPTKLPHYILPTYPALALLTAEAVIAGVDSAAPEIRSWLGKAGLIVGALVAFSLGLGILALAYFVDHRFSMWSVLAFGAAFTMAGFSVRQLFQNRLKQMIPLMVLGPVLIFAPVFQWVLPESGALWLSRSVARAVEQDAGKRPSSMVHLASAGYDEPSLIFLLGTDTELTSPERAALFLSKHPDGFALVNEKLDAAFQHAIDELGMPVTLLKKIDGINYSKGRKVILHLYTTKSRQLQS